MALSWRSLLFCQADGFEFRDLAEAGDGWGGLASARAEAVVDVVDEVSEGNGHDEVEEAREDERGEVAAQDGGILAHAEELPFGDEQAQEVHKARVLHDRDELVHERREDAADALRDDNEA